MPVTNDALRRAEERHDVGELLGVPSRPSGISASALGADVGRRVVLVGCALAASKRPSAGVSNWPVTTTLTSTSGRQLERQRAGGGGDAAAEHRRQGELGRGLDDGTGGQEHQPAAAAGGEMRRGGAADLERRTQHRVVGRVVVAVGGGE